jgi:hypothetical protein
MPIGGRMDGTIGRLTADARLPMAHQPLNYRDPAPGSKLVVVRVSWNIIVEVEADSTKQDVEFEMNESSQCSSRYINQLSDEEDRAEDGCCMSCGRFKAEVLRESLTEADRWDLIPAKDKTKA